MTYLSVAFFVFVEMSCHQGVVTLEGSKFQERKNVCPIESLFRLRDLRRGLIILLSQKTTKKERILPLRKGRLWELSIQSPPGGGGGGVELWSSNFSNLYQPVSSMSMADTSSDPQDLASVVAEWGVLGSVEGDVGVVDVAVFLPEEGTKDLALFVFVISFNLFHQTDD